MAVLAPCRAAERRSMADRDWCRAVARTRAKDDRSSVIAFTLFPADLQRNAVGGRLADRLGDDVVVGDHILDVELVEDVLPPRRNGDPVARERVADATV